MAYNHPSYNRLVLLAAVVLIMILKMEGSAGILPLYASPVEYWEKVLPDVRLPSQLRKRASPLDSSTELIVRYKDMISSGREMLQPASMCKAARLYCSAQKFAEFRQIHPKCGIQFNFRRPVYETDAQGHQTLMQSHGDFFRESALVEGAHLVLGDQKDRTPPTSFLPRPLAQLFQPVSAHLLQAAFSIPSASLLSKESIQTSQLCKADAQDLLPGEDAFCAYSLEDLADQLKAKVKVSVQILPVSGASATSVSAKLVKLELRAEAAQPYLSCHAGTFPFAVHFCHHIRNTRIYSATLRSTQGELIHAVALCHLDTSAWSPQHVAFADLHSTPGRTEACHWTHENGLIFVPTK